MTDVEAAAERFRTMTYTEDEYAVDQSYKDMRTLANAYLKIAARDREIERRCREITDEPYMGERVAGHARAILRLLAGDGGTAT